MGFTSLAIGLLRSNSRANQWMVFSVNTAFGLALLLAIRGKLLVAMALNAISGLGTNIINAFQRPAAQETGAEGASAAQAKLEASASKTTNKPNFLEQLVSVTNKSKPKPELSQMQDRLADLRARGKVVLHHPLDSTVKSYVKDLKDFLGDIRDHAYGSARRDDHFQKINIADRNLDALGEELLQSEKPELALLDSLGELQGLLIDVYV